MNRSRIGQVVALAGVLALGAAWGLGVRAAEEYKPKAEVTPLYEGALSGVASKTIIVKHFSLPAGFVGGKHYHPADVFVYVVEGALTVETEKGTQTVKAGELYPEVPGMVMHARNVSSDKATRIVVFQVGDTGKPMMIKSR